MFFYFFVISFFDRIRFYAGLNRAGRTPFCKRSSTCSANIANVAGSILQNSGNGYDITDSVANIAADTTSTVAKTAENGVITTISGDVSVGYTATAFENMKAIESYDTTDLASDKVANITIDASVQTKDVTIKLSDIKPGDHITLSATVGTGNDFLQGDDTANTLVDGMGADWLVGGKGADVIFAGSMTSQNVGKVYAECSDTIADGAINADFVKVFFGPGSDTTGLLPDVQKNSSRDTTLLKGAKATIFSLFPPVRGFSCSRPAVVILRARLRN